MTDRAAPDAGRPLSPGSGRPAPRVLTAVLLLVLGVLSWQLVAEGPLYRLDLALADALRQPVPVTDGPAQYAADLGAPGIALPVAALAMALRWWLDRRVRPLLGAALALAGVPLLVAPLKLLFDRPGPLGGDGYYPSGHTTTAVVAYGAAALLLWPYLRAALARVAVLALVGALVAATGAGLVVRGYHWPLDVAAGCAVGALLLLAGRGVGGGRGTGLHRFTGGRRAGRPPRASRAPGSPDR